MKTKNILSLLTLLAFALLGGGSIDDNGHLEPWVWLVIIILVVIVIIIAISGMSEEEERKKREEQKRLEREQKLKEQGII